MSFLSPCGAHESIIEQTEDNSFYTHCAVLEHGRTPEKLIWRWKKTLCLNCEGLVLLRVRHECTHTYIRGALHVYMLTLLKHLLVSLFFAPHTSPVTKGCEASLEIDALPQITIHTGRHAHRLGSSLNPVWRLLAVRCMVDLLFCSTPLHSLTTVSVTAYEMYNMFDQIQCKINKIKRPFTNQLQ